jgi:hypothetical protein
MKVLIALLTITVLAITFHDLHLQRKIEELEKEKTSFTEK